MATGFRTVDSKRYYFDLNGIMLHDCILHLVDGSNYKIDSNGVCTKM